MRDNRFVAEHRGGPLKKEQHIQLILWACLCAENVLHLFADKVDERLIKALFIAKQWAKGKVKTGEAIKASLEAHAAAREFTNPSLVAVARAVGHAVATAHMADHSLGGALYALKALKIADKDIESERKWQNEQLPPEIKELIISSRILKERVF